MWRYKNVPCTSLSVFCNRVWALKEKTLFSLNNCLTSAIMSFSCFLLIICEVFLFFLHFSQMPYISVMPQGHCPSQSINYLKCSWILTGLETPLKKLWVGGNEVVGEFVLEAAKADILVLWSHSETFMVLILVDSFCLLERKPPLVDMMLYAIVSWVIFSQILSLCWIV